MLVGQKDIFKTLERQITMTDSLSNYLSHDAEVNYRKDRKMTEKQNKLLHKHLDGVTEFSHRTVRIRTKPVTTPICEKCGAHPQNVVKREWVYENSCPIPDPYPGSEADIAEKIRVWFGFLDVESHRKADKIKEELGFAYQQRISNIGSATRSSNESTRLIFQVTPADKIAAAIKVWEEME